MTGASSEQLVAVRVSASALKAVMERRLHDPDFCLPLRMSTLLKGFSQWELNREGEVDVFRHYVLTCPSSSTWVMLHEFEIKNRKHRAIIEENR